jgi:uncharacterized RDD family membrane protein YckC
MKKEKDIAPIFRRFMAAFVDTSYILLIYFGFNIVGKNILGITYFAFDYLIIITCFCYLVIPTGLYGKTIGKWALRIKVVNPEGDNIGIGAAFAREIGGKFISILPFLIGIFWIIKDEKNRAWYDIFFETLVIKEAKSEKKK